MDFDLNLPWEDDGLDDIRVDDVDGNIVHDADGNIIQGEDEIVSFNNFSLDDYLYDDGCNDDVVGAIGDDETIHHEAVVNDDVNIDLHEPPIIEGGYVQKVANMLNMANTDVEEVDPPTEGMTFANGDEYGAYCYLYAYQRGFQFFIRTNKILDCYTEKGVKRHGSGDSEPRFYMMSRIRLCCTRGADANKKNGYINDPTYKKCECFVDASLKDDFIVIKKTSLEHNHDDVDPANSRHMVGYRLWHEYFRRRAIMNDEAGISIAKNFNTLVREVGGHANLPVKERDLRNMLNQERRRSRINGDANALEERFIKLREIDPDFYYSIETDKEGKLLNVFWADGRCRGMAKVFADAVSYDATFLCNRYKMPFTPFVGVNHHGSTVVLASALISHEDAISFTWVFKRWLDCMGRAQIGYNHGSMGLER
ncbi:protein FAR1-RELATED SEQUENCE 5-like [Silene latifolia]|uniref:protein FAR1-RELATED SEQUENCE 5-like n=1 Tax=Silene latifolia TaxID=37657 RepID=UPI003D771FD4